MKLQVTPYLAIELAEPNELIELIDDDDKVDFFQSLSCDNIIFKHVADQIISGCTDDGYHGSIGQTSDNPNCPLQIAQRDIAKSANDIASREIDNLELMLNATKKDLGEMTDKYYDLYHKANRI